MPDQNAQPDQYERQIPTWQPLAVPIGGNLLGADQPFPCSVCGVRAADQSFRGRDYCPSDAPRFCDDCGLTPQAALTDPFVATVALVRRIEQPEVPGDAERGLPGRPANTVMQIVRTLCDVHNADAKYSKFERVEVVQPSNLPPPPDLSDAQPVDPERCGDCSALWTEHAVVVGPEGPELACPE